MPVNTELKYSMSPVVESRNSYRFLNKMNTQAPNQTDIKSTKVDLQKKVNLTQYDEKASDHNSKLSLYPLNSSPQLANQNSLTKNP